jgi:hypothetical protein
MGDFIERTGNIAITSPAIARLVKRYSHYVQDCIMDTQPIIHITDFYYKMLREKEMNKSRIYEKYLSDLSHKKEINGGHKTVNQETN